MALTFSTGAKNTQFCVQQGTILTSLNAIERTFGKPNRSIENGDVFDGLQSMEWAIQFSDGNVAILTDVKSFGVYDDIKKNDVMTWRVLGRTPIVASYVKELLELFSQKHGFKA